MNIENPYISAILIAMGNINMGFGLVFASFTLISISKEFKLTSNESIMFNVSGILSAVIGALIINLFIPKYGKKNCTFYSSFFTFISWILLGLSKSKITLFLFRCFSGSSMGLFSTICPSFISELAPFDKKFLFGFMNQIGIVIGFLLVTVFGVL